MRGSLGRLACREKACPGGGGAGSHQQGERAVGARRGGTTQRRARDERICVGKECRKAEEAATRRGIF